ncbi:ABC transporter permease [Natrialba sp. INN-245]|uniref:ABC transporter permease n=1 Tax=Natrialba sp. INN-245 TaxID=2690967 RepID=UPI001311D587|nr:ABC transporter permease [Natrialba sp. INN-245]MWV41988.1 ABC transporter permease subunit [Natrialba sp. INN-245]
MKRYVVKRIAQYVPVMFGVTLIAFLLINVAGGDPVRTMLGTEASEEQVQMIREDLGLDQPLYVRYVDWLGDVLTGDLGTSIMYGQPVSDLIVQTLPVTFWLAGGALLVSIFIGIPAGIVSATRRNTKFDSGATIAAYSGIAIPNFFLGILLILVFAEYLRVLPASGFVSPLADPIQGIRHLILPWIALGTAQAAIVMRYMRSSLLEVMDQQYVEVARSKGLVPALIQNKHSIMNALIPTVTIIGINLGYLLGGSIVIEEIFALPGFGRLALNGVLNRDFLILQGVLLVTAFLFTTVNFVVDILYTYLDPRIRYE